MVGGGGPGPGASPPGAPPPRTETTPVGVVVDEGADIVAFQPGLRLSVSTPRRQPAPQIAVIGPFTVVPNDLTPAPRRLLPVTGDLTVDQPGLHILAAVVDPAAAALMVGAGTACVADVAFDGRVQLSDGGGAAARTVSFSRRYTICGGGPVLIDRFADFSIQARQGP
jgi:hypothetical protein